VRAWRGSIWSDKRLWAALALSVALRWVLAAALEPERPERFDELAVAPTRPAEPGSGPLVDLERAFRDRQIRRIHLHDGSSAEPPMSAEAAAAWIGGLVLFLGGFGAVWLWRRAEQAEDLDQDEQFPAA
jgi:hypothetical protein